MHDPLPDSLYVPFHSKMKREEKSMAEVDKNKLANEIDNIQQQLQLLHENLWLRNLLKVAYIRDKSDPTELSRKRQLAITELQRVLDKFTDWLRRSLQRLSEIRENEPDSDDEGVLADVANGHIQASEPPIYRLNLRNGHALVFGPCIYPRIESCSELPHE